VNRQRRSERGWQKNKHNSSQHLRVGSNVQEAGCVVGLLSCEFDNDSQQQLILKKFSLLGIGILKKKITTEFCSPRLIVSANLTQIRL